jgi:hypothetical protein
LNYRSMSKLQQTIAAGMFLLFISSNAIASWPTTKFEVFEGMLEKSMFGIEEVEAPAPVPLTPQLKLDIESYYEEVAWELQKNLPPPAMRIIVDETSGEKKYRIYYHQFAPDDPRYSSYAVFTTSADCDPQLSHITLNPTLLTEGGKISHKGLGDMPHELVHAIHRNMAAGRHSCQNGYDIANWVLEGQAEAVGIYVAHTLKGVWPDDNPIVAHGLRAYSLPLAISGQDIGGRKLREFSYQTSSFWRYLAERRHLEMAARDKPNTPPERPGPDYYPGHGEDYSYLAELFKQPVAGGSGGELTWLEKYLSANFGASLSQIYPEFVAVFSEYARYRIKGQYDAESRVGIWRAFAFAPDPAADVTGCTQVRLMDREAVGQIELELSRVAARCVAIVVGELGAPLAWTIQIQAESLPLLKQVRISMAGGQETVTSGELGVANGKPIAHMGVTLQPSALNILLVSNAHSDAQYTRPHTATLRFTLEESPNTLAERAPVADAGASQDTPSPGPRGAAQARKQNVERARGQQAGAGTADLSRTKGGDCKHCAGETQVDLFNSPQFNADLIGANEFGAHNAQMMDFSVLTILDPKQMADAMSSNHLRIIMPHFEYGFTGELDGVRITVPGDDSWAALDPVPEYPSEPCIWNTPNGRVRIEEFTPFILRGSYEAALVDTKIPRNTRKCRTKDVVHSLKGSFTVAAPWLSDPDHPADMSWILEDQSNNSSTAGIATPEPDSNMDMGPGMGNPSSKEVGPSDCDCSCAAFSKAMSAMQNGMFGGASADPEAARLVQCAGYCMADALKAGCDPDL